MRSGKWKLHLRPPSGQNAARQDAAAEALPLLYDLDADIGEKENLAAANPEVVKRLTALFEAFRKELDAHCRPAGLAGKTPA